MPQLQPSHLNGYVREKPARSPWLDVGPDGEGMQIFDFPSYIVGRLSGILRRSLIPSYVEPHSLSIPEWRLLAFLVSSEPSSFNEICAALVMDRGQVSRTLPILVKKGAIKRTVILRKGPRRRGESGQQTKFVATAKGRALYQRVLPLAQRQQMVLLGALNETEKDALYSALRKVMRAAERFEKEQTVAVSAKQVQPRPKRRSARAKTAVRANGREKRISVIAGGLS